MNKCPFYAEETENEAVKCRSCGEFLNKSSKSTIKWHFKMHIVVIALPCLGPQALPLVWLYSRCKTITKIVVTIIVIAIGVCCCLIIRELYLQLAEQMKALGLR